jgi:hypothetical protein
LETVCKCFRVDRREIGFLRFIFEGYDGLAFLSTIDREAGEVSICMAAECKKEVEAILNGLTREMLIEPVPCRSCTSPWR